MHGECGTPIIGAMHYCDCRLDCPVRSSSSCCSSCAIDACAHCPALCPTDESPACRECGGMDAIQDSSLCAECDRTALVCEECGAEGWLRRNRPRASSITLYRTVEAGIYCIDHCRECEQCGETWHDSEGAAECCRYEDGLHDHSFKPDPIFHASKGRIVSSAATTRRVFMGVELEYDYGSPGCRFDLLTDADPGENRYYLKEDSSVTGGELVTHPGTINAWRDGSVVPWNAWSQWRATTGAVTNDGTGFHVHVNRTAFAGTPHLYRFHQLLTLNSGPWSSIGRRVNTSWARWRSEEDEENAPEHIWSKVKNRYECRGRYYAVNLTNSHTVELRFPKSTTDPRTIIATLGLLEAAVEHTRRRKHTGPHYAWRTFLIDTVLAGRYPDTIAYLARRNLSDPTAAPTPEET